MRNWKPLCLTDGTLHLTRRRLFREVLLVGENHLEHRVILGRWRRVTRITDGWVYLEKIPTCGDWQRFRVCVRGRGGEVVLTDCQRLDWDESCVPAEIAQLAERVAQTTQWRLDVPYLLRRGSQIRTI